MDNLNQSKAFLAKHAFSLNVSVCLRASLGNLAPAIFSWNYLKK